MSGRRTVDLSFLKHILIVLAASALLGMYPVRQYASAEVTEGIVAGVVLSVINALLGFAVLQFSVNKSYTTFVQIVLGGIAVRLFVMVGLLLASIVVLKIDSVSLVSSLFVMYIVLLTVEVLYIHNKVQHSLLQ